MISEKKEIDDFLRKLFPIHRSLSGAGNRETFKILKELVNGLNIISIKSGEEVFDWNVPPEWSVDEAYVENKNGKKIIDIKNNNLHLVSYSDNFEGFCTSSELKDHLFTLPSKPDWIPYRTSYYKNTWGFCAKHSLLDSDDFIEPFKVVIKTNKDIKGSLDYAEALKKGKSNKEIILSTYCCHPSMANDNLSGLIVACFLFRYISQFNTRFSYRLVIAPETIGTICFLKNANLKNITGGTILTTIGGQNKFSIKESFNKESWLNKISHLCIKDFTNNNYLIYPFTPSGSDERQFSSPGIKIETPSFHKSKFHEYEEYHTSADNLSYVKSENILMGLNLYKKWFSYIDSFCFPKRKMMFGEYQLGKRDLYPNIGGSQKQVFNLNEKEKNLKSKFDFYKNNSDDYCIESIQWLMHLADGNNSNVDIAIKSNLPLERINNSISILLSKSLIDIS